MQQHEKINYVEFASCDLAASKQFFADTFGWQFQDYGDAYSAFSGAGLDGGFFSGEQTASTATGSALIVLYSNNLEDTQEKIEQAGGRITQAIFAFPGGRRFHFREPGGNELAVWSEQGVSPSNNEETQ